MAEQKAGWWADLMAHRSVDQKADPMDDLMVVRWDNMMVGSMAHSLAGP
jgi:hypothetical protein